MRRKKGHIYKQCISQRMYISVAIAIAVPAILYRGVHVDIDVSIAAAVAIPVASFRSVPV